MASPLESEVGEISTNNKEKGQSIYRSFRMCFPSMRSCTGGQTSVEGTEHGLLNEERS